MKVFISWSGERAKAVAAALREWLPDVINAVEPWMSDEDIESGARWAESIAKGLANSNYGIICTTPENIGRPWLLFEAGALAKGLDSRVAPFLFGFPSVSLGGSPLSLFQAKRANKDETRKLLADLNKSFGLDALEEARLNRAFDRAWPDLEQRLQAIPAAPSAPQTPSQAETLNELLTLVRNLGSEVERLRQEMRATGLPAVNRSYLAEGGLTGPTGSPERLFAGSWAVRQRELERDVVQHVLARIPRDGRRPSLSQLRSMLPDGLSEEQIVNITHVLHQYFMPAAQDGPTGAPAKEATGSSGK